MPCTKEQPSFILNIPVALQNFTTALLSFLFPSATSFKNFPSVSQTSTGYCSSSTPYVYFFLIQNTQIPSEMTKRKIKMKQFILILVTKYTLLSSLCYKNCLFYVLLSRLCWFALAPAAYVFCLHTETIKSLNGNRSQFTYYARVSLHTII